MLKIYASKKSENIILRDTETNTFTLFTCVADGEVPEPEQVDTKEKQETLKRKCGNCGKGGHNARGCTDEGETAEEIGAERDEGLLKQIEELRDEGLTSMQVSIRLGIPLKKINQLWRFRKEDQDEYDN